MGMANALVLIQNFRLHYLQYFFCILYGLRLVRSYTVRTLFTFRTVK